MGRPRAASPEGGYPRSHAHSAPAGSPAFSPSGQLEAGVTSVTRVQPCLATMARAAPHPPSWRPWSCCTRCPSAWVALRGLSLRRPWAAPWMLGVGGGRGGRPGRPGRPGLPQGSAAVSSDGLKGCRCWTLAGAWKVLANRDAGQQATCGRQLGDRGGWNEVRKMCSNASWGASVG